MLQSVSRWFGSVWLDAFPIPPPPNGPGIPPLRIGEMRLSEGALLSERTDAVAKRRLR